MACAFTLLFVNTGFTSTSFSIYQSYIVNIPGVGDVGGSVVVTVRTFVSLICMFFTGVYFRRLNPRIGFFIATLFTALAFFLFGRAYSLAGLCVASAFAGIGYGFGGMVASTYLIGNWFRGKVGSVSGIATMGSGVAAIFIPILAGWLIDAFSLSLAFYVEAAIAFILALLLFKFVRVKPKTSGSSRSWRARSRIRRQKTWRQRALRKRSLKPRSKKSTNSAQQPALQPAKNPQATQRLNSTNTAIFTRHTMPITLTIFTAKERLAAHA